MPRVSYNGITPAFQADDRGSIPLTRSRIKNILEIKRATEARYKFLKVCRNGCLQKLVSNCRVARNVCAFKAGACLSAPYGSEIRPQWPMGIYSVVNNFSCSNHNTRTLSPKTLPVDNSEKALFAYLHDFPALWSHYFLEIFDRFSGELESALLDEPARFAFALYGGTQDDKIER